MTEQSKKNMRRINSKIGRMCSLLLSEDIESIRKAAVVRSELLDLIESAIEESAIRR